MNGPLLLNLILSSIRKNKNLKILDLKNKRKNIAKNCKNKSNKRFFRKMPKMMKKINMPSFCNYKWLILMKEKIKKKKKNWTRFNMKKNPEIDNWRMRPAVKEMKRKDKKNWILFWFKESKKKSKKLNLFNFKEKFKELNISRD